MIDRPKAMMLARYRKVLDANGVDHSGMDIEAMKSITRERGLKFTKRKRPKSLPPKTKPLVFGETSKDIPPPEHYTRKRKREIPSPISILEPGQSVQVKEVFSTRLSARIRSHAKNFRKEHGLSLQEWKIKAAPDPLNKLYTRVWRIK